MYDDNSYMVGVIEAAVSLQNAISIEQASTAYNTLMSDATQLGMQTFKRLHSLEISELRTKLHDAQVVAAGGM